MQELNILSTSIDENTGIASIIIEGTIKIPKECDNPIVELFRPIRLKYSKEMLFTILILARNGSISSTIIPSNRRARKIDEFLATAIEILEGNNKYPGMIREYTEILEKYFISEKGLKTYIKLAEEAEKADNSTKSAKIKKCNESIKSFVAEEGLIMPSFKKRKKPAN